MNWFERWMLRRIVRKHIGYNTYYTTTDYMGGIRQLYRFIREQWESTYTEECGLSVDYDLRATFEETQCLPLTKAKQLDRF